MNVKKILLLAAAGVLVYTLIAHPNQLGDGVQTVFGWIGDGIQSIFTFVRSAFE